MNRIFDFSEDEVKLRVDHSQLEIQWMDGRKMTTPICEIAVVVLSAWRISLTKNVLEELAKAGAVLVVCDEKKLPIGMMTPLVGHHKQSRFMQEQASASVVIRKRVWKTLVQAKIRSQAWMLKEIFGTDYRVGNLAEQVKSGDSTNIEARAARKYWQHLFAEVDFRRDPESEDSLNIALNYGYAILRSITARAIVSAGLNPSLGVFHHHMYNPFCLADDLMEPLRPVVDRCVYRLAEQEKLAAELTPTLKKTIIDAISGRYIVAGCQETIFETVCQIASSLVNVLGGRQTEIELPECLPREVK